MEVKQEKPGLETRNIAPSLIIAFNHQRIQSINDQTRNVPSHFGFPSHFGSEKATGQGWFYHPPILSGSWVEATQERKAVQLYVSLASKYLEESGSVEGGDHRRLRLGVKSKTIEEFHQRKTYNYNFMFHRSCISPPGIGLKESL